MADFLTRMTQRTLGLLPVVQPIIASKYGSESADAYMPGGAAPNNPDQAMEESFEDWEGMAERVAPSATLQQEQPSTPKIQPAKAAPVRPHEVQPLRETAGGEQPSQLVPQQEPEREMHQGAELSGQGQLPGRGQAPPLPYTKPNPAPGIQENQPFSSSPSSKPRRGLGKPSSHSDVGTRFIASLPGDSLVPPQSSDLPQIDQTSHVGTRFIASRSVTRNEGNLVSASSSMSANTGGNPAANRENLASARHTGTTPVPVQTRAGKPASFPYMKQDTDPYRVEAGHAPALVSSPPPPPNTKYDPDPYRVGAGSLPDTFSRERDRMPTRGIPTSEATPHLAPHQSSPSRGRDGKVRRDVVTPLVGVRGQVPPLVPSPLPTVSPAQVAEASLVEPMFSPVYPSVQNRRTATTATGNSAAAQQAESHDAPTIRVTIGRIDVRAVAPPPAPSEPVRTRHSQPALSLKDYLKQRNGG